MTTLTTEEIGTAASQAGATSRKPPRRPVLAHVAPAKPKAGKKPPGPRKRQGREKGRFRPGRQQDRPDPGSAEAAWRRHLEGTA
jgi:hypothetical protein